MTVTSAFVQITETPEPLLPDAMSALALDLLVARHV